MLNNHLGDVLSSITGIVDLNTTTYICHTFGISNPKVQVRHKDLLEVRGRLMPL